MREAVLGEREKNVSKPGRMRRALGRRAQGRLVRLQEATSSDVIRARIFLPVVFQCDTAKQNSAATKQLSKGAKRQKSRCRQRCQLLFF